MFLNIVSLSANPLYHRFTPGWNWWYLVMPLFVVIAIWLGVLFNKWISIARDRKIHLGGRPFTLKTKVMLYDLRPIVAKLIATLMTLVVSVMIYKESWHGIMQFINNHDNTGGFAIFFVIPMAIIGFLAYWFILYDIMNPDHDR